MEKESLPPGEKYPKTRPWGVASMSDLLEVRAQSDIVGPSVPFAGWVKPNSRLCLYTEPGCIGPKITPQLRSGHVVTQPVGVEGAEPGDAIVIRIERLDVISKATASGTEVPRPGHFVSSASVGKKCAACGRLNPDTYLQGTGLEAIRCRHCGQPVLAFTPTHFYTVVMDQERKVALTVDAQQAEQIAHKAYEWMGLNPAQAVSYPAVLLAQAQMAGGIPLRMRPMIGNVGTVPSVDMPSSNNCGDFGQAIIGAEVFGITAEQLAEARTDAHMDIDSVRAGSVLICPVKVPGGGVFAGDVHAFQGDGEIAGHTSDVAARVEVIVDIIKGLAVDGPILLPPLSDLPPLAKPLSDEEQQKATALAQEFGTTMSEEWLPLQMIGSGADLAQAVENGLARLEKLTGLGRGEIRNRVTMAGAVEIGRLPGMIQITLPTPLDLLQR
jgi:formamidase